MVEYDFMMAEKLWELVYFLIEKIGGEIDEEIRKELDEKILRLCEKIY